MDQYLEQLVVKEKTANDRFMQYAFMILGVLIILFTAVYALTINFILFLLCVLEAYGLYYLLQQFHIEYEYSLTNDQLEVDLIFAKSKRKHLVSLSCRSIVQAGNYSDYKKGTPTLMAGNPKAKGLIYLTFADKQDGNKTVIIQPNDEFCEGIKRYTPRSVWENNY